MLAASHKPTNPNTRTLHTNVIRKEKGLEGEKPDYPD
jgi:hypothetical protein